MTLGCGFWCSRQPRPEPSDDAIVSPVLPPSGATQPNSDSPSGSRDVRNATVVEIARPGFAPGPSNADIPIPSATQVSHSSHPTYRLDRAVAKKHIDRIHRFRILIMGRANAGKTTILQRICNTTDQPELFNGDGQKVDATVVQGSLTRGHHNIEDELVFQSNPGFVFHDSCGFEAGNEEQFDKMYKFVVDRAKTTKLDKRIHAIWFCIPLTDIHRMVTASEVKFFDMCNTGHVPVILLATKADTLELEAIQKLEDQECCVGDGAGATKLQREILNEYMAKIMDWLGRTVFPPHDYLSLSGMEQEGAECTPLLKCTANALSEEGLQQLLISTQQSNLGVCIEFAIMKTLKKCMNGQVNKIGPTSLALILSRWFPYKYYYQPPDQGLDLPGPFHFGGTGQQGLSRAMGGTDGSMLTMVTANLWHLGSTVGQGGHLGLPLDPDRGLGKVPLADRLGLPQQDAVVDDDLVPAINHPCQTLKMPTLSTAKQHSMQFIVEHGIGTILVFEYLYFLLQAKKGRDDLKEDLAVAVQEYHTSGIQATVNKLINKAFQENSGNVERLCHVLVDIARQNQISKTLHYDG